MATAILQGFPLGASDQPLSRWTILLPNRRSARALENILLAESGARALLLPRIKPIGDIDEDEVSGMLPEDGVPDGISKTHQLHAILSLVMQWARAQVDVPLANDILTSGAQAFALAQSLQHLINQIETEDADPGNLQNLYDLDLAGHRANILSLLRLVSANLPEQLAQQQLIGPAARRNLLIRLEAERIAKRRHRGPIVAAGSTGTNPATRDLLRVIASDTNGAVILPGLDTELDAAGWQAITAEHPQFALKTMLDQWGVSRGEVRLLGQPSGPRSWFTNMALRPAAVADAWSERLQHAPYLASTLLNEVELVEAIDRSEEALVIALRLREHVEISTAPAALVTPDRDLARRVAMALKRWNITIDDSGGESLIRVGRAALLHLVLKAIHEKFSAESLLALLHHPDCTLGQSRDVHLALSRWLELSCFRGLPASTGLGPLRNRLRAQHAVLKNADHRHPVVAAIPEVAWERMDVLLAKLTAIFAAVHFEQERPLAEHLELLVSIVEQLAPSVGEQTAADQRFFEIIADLQSGSAWHPVVSLARAQHSIVNALTMDTLRKPLRDAPQLAIYGLAEARLIEVELIILGGLAEGQWPAHPETGPWLNRPMRETLKLQQPEREIGVTAHDFTQGFGHPKIMVTWPKRLGNAPTTPSRWILRMRAVLSALGLEADQQPSKRLTEIAERLDHPNRFKPIVRPAPTPPLAVRPRRFSVTRIETLVRDSYAIYARFILGLEPMPALNQDVDASLRGSLIHAALQAWTGAESKLENGDGLALLLAKGRAAFAPYMDMPEVLRFWWPRFERMAVEFIAKDDELRFDAISSKSEVNGYLVFDVNGAEHVLTARADRLDITANGRMQIIDYKSGSIPSKDEIKSGFSPQLTLEAAMANRRAFAEIKAQATSDAIYIGVGGASSGLIVQRLSEHSDIEKLSETQFANLQTLLAQYLLPTTAYIPRHNMQREDDDARFDHLSRRREWQLRGGVR